MVKSEGLIESIRKTLGVGQLELALILGYLSDRANQSLMTRLIDLVYTQEFGDGPTVNDKILKLGQNNLIEIKRDDDSSVKTIAITRDGVKWLQTIETGLLTCASNVQNRCNTNRSC